MTVPAQDPVAAAGQLSSSLDAMAGELRRLNSRERVNRRMIVSLAVSLALDLVLTVIVAITAVQAHNASTRATDASAAAEHASASNTALCQASNTSRAQQIDLWNFLLSLGKPPATAAERKVISGFRAYLDRDFAPRNCAALGRRKLCACPGGGPVLASSPLTPKPKPTTTLFTTLLTRPGNRIHITSTSAITTASTGRRRGAGSVSGSGSVTAVTPTVSPARLPKTAGNSPASSCTIR
jgi:hypothetical protein